MKHYIIAFVLVLGLAVPAMGLAQGTSSVSGNNQGNSSVTVDNSQKTELKVTSSGTVKLENPLKGVNSIADFFYLIINFVYSLSYVVIAAFLLLSGFKFVMAQGKPDALDDAKSTFKHTIIGAIILISANVLTEVVRTVINQFVVTSI